MYQKLLCKHFRIPIWCVVDHGSRSRRTSHSIFIGVGCSRRSGVVIKREVHVLGSHPITTRSVNQRMGQLLAAGRVGQPPCRRVDQCRPLYADNPGSRSASTATAADSAPCSRRQKTARVTHHRHGLRKPQAPRCGHVQLVRTWPARPIKATGGGRHSSNAYVTDRSPPRTNRSTTDGTPRRPARACCRRAPPPHRDLESYSSRSGSNSEASGIGSPPSSPGLGINVET
jgi:hypothetical protein